MRSSYDDTISVSNHLILRDDIKGFCAMVHCRIKHICIESEQEFAHMFVCTWTDGIHILVYTGLCPWVESEILIIDKDSSVLDRRTV